MDLLNYLIRDEQKHKEYMDFCTSKSYELLNREEIKNMDLQKRLATVMAILVQEIYEKYIDKE